MLTGFNGLKLAAIACLLGSAALAETTFPPPVEFAGRVRVGATAADRPIFAGSEAVIQISGLKPGQTATFQRGGVKLNDAPVAADDKGAMRFRFTLPADAAVGLHPVVAFFDNPSSVKVIDVKVSNDMPLVGAELYAATTLRHAPGLYQVAYSALEDAVFVTATNFAPGSSQLMRLDPETLALEASVTPADFPEEQRIEKKSGGHGSFELTPAAVYGLGLDNKNGTIWVTNTSDNTIAVYAQKDLALIHQFAPGATPHSRDVRIDPDLGLAYVSAAASNKVYVFDTTTYAEKAVIEIASAARGGEFYVMGLALDGATKKLYAVSRVSNEVAEIDAATLKVDRVIALPGAKNATGVDIDPRTGRLFVASQDSDNLLILDIKTGAVLHDVAVGAGALNVVYDPAKDLAYVSSRGAGTITAVDAAGKVVAHLDGGTHANHAAVDDEGTVFAVNKALAMDDPRGDQILRLVPQK